MFTRLARVLAWMIVVMPPAAWGLGLGDIEAQSALNEPFDARIDLVSPEQESTRGVSVDLAPREAYERAGLERMGALRKLEFSVEKGPGGPYIQVKSEDPVSEPFLTFLVELSWPQGRVQREYTVFLDPPTMVSEKPRAAEGPATRGDGQTSPAPVERAAEDQGAADQPQSRRQAQRETGAPASAAGDRERQRQARTGAERATPSEYGPIRRGETLWEIAQRTRVGTDVTQNQMMLAIYRRNPDAFEGNINRLKQGAVLRIPEAREAGAIERQQAIRTVRRQNETYRAEVQQRTGQPDTEVASADGGDSRLELVAPEKESGGRESGTGSRSAGGPGSGEGDTGSGASGEGSETASAERVRDLEERVQELQEMVTVQDTRLAELQQRLEEARESDDESGGDQGEPADGQQADAGDGETGAAADDAGADASGDETDVAVAGGDEAAPSEQDDGGDKEGDKEGDKDSEAEEADKKTGKKAAEDGEAEEKAEGEPEEAKEELASGTDGTDSSTGAEDTGGDTAEDAAQATASDGQATDRDREQSPAGSDQDESDEPTTVASADGGGSGGSPGAEPGGTEGPQSDGGGGSIMQQARSLLDQGLSWLAPVRGAFGGNPMMLAGLGAAVLLLLSGGLYAARRRSAAKAEAAGGEPGLEGLGIAGGADAPADAEAAGSTEETEELGGGRDQEGGQEPDEAATAVIGEPGDVAAGTSAGEDFSPEDVDPASEIDFHLSHGLHDEAREIADKAVQRDPDNRDLWLKRLQVHHAAGDSDRFLTEAKELADAPQGQADSVWEKVASLGRQILPSEPLFQQGEQGGADALDVDQAGVDADTDTAIGTTTAETTTAEDVPGGGGDQEGAGELDVDVGDLEFDLSEAEQAASEGPAAGSGGGTGSDEVSLEADLEPSTEGTGETSASPSADDLSLDFDLEEADTAAAGSEAGEEAGSGSGEEEAPTLSADDLAASLDTSSGDTGEFQPVGESAGEAEQASGADDTSDALDIDLEGLDTGTGELPTGESESSDATAAFSAEEMEQTTEAPGEPGADQTSEASDESAPATEVVGERASSSADDTLDGGTEQTSEASGESAASTQVLDEPTSSSADATLGGDTEAGSSSDADEISTKLDLAEAYIGMDDTEGARSLLDEVLSEGSSEQQEKARELMERLGGNASGSTGAEGGSEAASTDASGGVDTQGDEPLGEGDDVGTKLDLARAYIGMEDNEGARNILNEVIRDGDEAQRREAETLLQELS